MPFSPQVWVSLALAVILLGCIMGVYLFLHVLEVENKSLEKCSLIWLLLQGVWISYASLFQQG